MQAVGFDYGNTLVSNGLPPNWQSFYQDAIKDILHNLGTTVDTRKLQAGEKVLLKYNTRVNDREYEVGSTTIFTELFREWSITDPEKLHLAKDSFYSYFLKRTKIFPETEQTLKELKSRNIKIGVLTDVAYGADNKYLLAGATELAKYLDCFLSSSDVGLRKPNTQGYFQLARGLGVEVGDCWFVGDEPKDIVGANRSGMISVLIDRDYQKPNYGQKYTIESLRELLALV